jgi:hypothetical protein
MGGKREKTLLVSLPMKKRRKKKPSARKQKSFLTFSFPFMRKNRRSAA